MILFFAFFAGVLSVLAPCVLPLLPVLLWAGFAQKNKASPYIILISALFFIFVFTFFFKLATGFLPLSQEVFTGISWVLILFYGVLLLYPDLWERIKGFFPFLKQQTVKKEQKNWFWSDVLLGASLGPIFASCSPTYALIISTILPASLLMGTLSILAYILGFGAVIFVVIYFGKEVLQTLRRYANPDGIFKKIIGIVLIITGILVMTGGFKWIETQLVNRDFGSSLMRIEQNAIKNLK